MSKLNNSKTIVDYKEEVKQLYRADRGLTSSGLLEIISDTYGLGKTESDSRTIRRWMSSVREEDGVIDNHSALAQQCDEIGLPVEAVKQYWHKGEHFSINLKGLNNHKSHIEIFNDHIEEVRDSISNSFEWKTIKYDQVQGDNLFVPNIFDLHLGKLAWGEETGEDYDINIAQQRFHTALDDLISKSSGYKIDEILFPVGNDIYNSDRALPFSQTTAGTPQQDDSRWQKMFRTGTKLITEAIIKLSQIAPVKVKMVYSNHDFERVFYLGEVLSAVFANHPGVEIDNSPKVRKYYQYGKVLIALAHGHNEKPADLPLIMAQEASEMWSNTFYREWLLGHLHHRYTLMTQSAKDYKGVNVRYLTSPSAPDFWHQSRGYVGAIKGAEGFIYNKEEGLIGSVVHNIK
jgi:hypothetical protein